jgi:hypothetical protein
MKEALKAKLHEFITKNNGDLLLELEEEGKVSEWLEQRLNSLEDLPDILLGQGKPSYIVEEICMDALTGDLRFSKYSYLSSLLETDFESEYYRWIEVGILRYEIVNLIETCRVIFETTPLNGETIEDESLRIAVSGKIQEYLESK